MPETGRPGVAYPFWLEMERRLKQLGESQRAFAARTGIPVSTFNRLKSQSRAPQPRIVNAIADALGINRDDAHRLAGTIPAEPVGSGSDVRAAIVASPAYTPDQKRMLLQMIDVLDTANGSPLRVVGNDDQGEQVTEQTG